MPAESLASGPAPSTVDGLNTDEAGALGTTITGEEVWSGGAARRATTQETLTVLGQGDSVSSILIRSPQVRAYDGGLPVIALTNGARCASALSTET
jgi:hypothetical protein